MRRSVVGAVPDPGADADRAAAPAPGAVYPGEEAPAVARNEPASTPASLVPQLPQKLAPATTGAAHVGQPMRAPHRTQNFVSGGFSAVQFEQITVGRLYPSRRATVTTAAAPRGPVP